MPNLIHKAAEGNRAAMLELFNQNKRKVYYLALRLLSDKQKAADVTIAVFSNIWSKISVSAAETEEQFTETALKSAVEYCKALIIKKNSKAYRIPQNRNFVSKQTAVVPFDDNLDNIDIVLSQLSELQKLILVLRTVSNFDELKVASFAKLDIKTLNHAIDCEKANIEKAIELLKMQNEISFDDIIKELENGEKNCEIDDNIDNSVTEIIDGIAGPIKKKKQTKIIITTAACVLMCLSVAICIFAMIIDSKNNPSQDESSSQSQSEETGENANLITDAKGLNPTHYADIEIEDYGTIKVALDANIAPETVNNFVNLANEGFYDGLTFHRIMDGFMMQGGDPKGNGTGGNEDENGNEINIKGEFAANGFTNNISHKKGCISMARGQENDSASSQFFIVHEDSAESLDGQYAGFGFVTEGMEIVDKVCTDAQPIDNNGTIPPANQPVITSVKITTAS